MRSAFFLLILLFTLVKYGSSNGLTISDSDEIKCLLYGTNDINNLSTFVSRVKERIKKNEEKISIENPIDSLQKASYSTNENSNFRECFALTEEQTRNISPILKINTIHGLNKLKSIVDDTSVSESRGKMDELMRLIKNMKANNKDGSGIEWYCKNIILLDNNNRYSPTITNYCKFVINFKHNKK